MVIKTIVEIERVAMNIIAVPGVAPLLSQSLFAL